MTAPAGDREARMRTPALQTAATAIYLLAFRALHGRRAESWLVIRTAYHVVCRLATMRRSKVVVDFFGAHVAVPTSDQTMVLALMSQNYERAAGRLVCELLKPGSRFLDLGANIGLYTTLASRIVGPTGSVTAVEPIAETRQWLEENLHSNKCENVEIWPIAAGDSAGTLRLVRVAGELGTASAHHSGDIIEYVPVNRLDDLLPHEAYDVIKADIEGHELAALRGMPNLLRNEDLVLLMEYTHNECADDLRQFLAEHFSHLWIVNERRQTFDRTTPGELRRFSRINIVAAQRDLAPTFRRLRSS